MSTAVKRACDACHRRKVKCDGVNPCRNCSSAQLTCTYNAIPQKKGPKGSRAKVISELRETQRATSLSAKVQSRLNGLASPPCAPSMAPNHGILAPELVKEAIDFFFGNMYSIMPILSKQRLEQQAIYMEQSLDTYCMVASLSAFMLLQPGFIVPGGDPLFEHPGANITSSQLLMEEAIRVRKGYEYTETPTLNTLCTSYFLFGCYYALEMHDKAWYHLREATTLAHMVGMTQEDKYMQFDTIEGSRRRRLYWQLFITERAYALKYGRPMSLPATINPPNLADDPTDPLAHQLNNHIILVNLFRPFDDTFMLLWNKTRSECTPAYLAALQKQLSEIHLPYGADSDIRANQSWLKTVAWNMSVQNGMSPGSDDMASYQYPIDMSRDLTSITSQFSTPSTELLGVPLAAKLLDVSCNLADVLSMMPSSGDPFSITPQQQLQSLLQLCSVLRGGEHHFMHLLLNKVNDTLPRLANPLLQRVPDNICSIDIFDGFGNAGMAQPPVLTDFKAEQHFKPEPYTPTPVPRVDEIAHDSASSNGAPTTTDLNSPFPMASSPNVMSPGNVDYQHIAEYNSIPDIMSSMGQSQPSTLAHSSHLNQQPMQHPQQHQGFQQGIQQQHNHTMHGQMQNSIQGQLGQSMSQQQNFTSISHQQQTPGSTQGYNSVNQGMAQNLMNNILHRQPPQRSNSFIIHQQQQTPQIPRTVGEFHALQRTNSDHVSMNSMSMNAMNTDMDFSNLR
ncbi:hypothetical protein BKA67DRAFT_593847 [Truncatella angustata]|uniref:Zn(2)-C6 fungal-type domain-containing protein n=1 Tax=Truncatella angustata TaxID=152316 RepID=A0A9P8ZWV0_9PEZI|nr:uncharacterized protein BKA67DRAFT_593847 [Truncatella angustata]KAH6652353.1 hypothetical protein BKA67DRAFT_593847 [Truncatella angustata]KAH8205149.1 hypothetical protein TruAng_000714 [Truncatella angustata]